MKTIWLLVLLLTAISAKNPALYREFCKGHAKCYSLFEDPFTGPLWRYDDFTFWGSDNYHPPYVSWAISAAMAATFSMRFIHKILQLPYDMEEWLSAAYIMLQMHSYSYVNDYFNCTVPNELGSFVMYIAEEYYLIATAICPSDSFNPIGVI